ncbi:MAG: dipeptidase [Candidatus Omnitrophota bacterium]
MSNEKKVRMDRFACTIMIVGKEASTDGSVIISHTDDGLTDGRVIYVPARKWDLSLPDENKRPVYYDNASLGSNLTYNSTDIRRYIGNYRGPGYQTQSEGYAESRPIGYIDQVAETYAYFDSSYGIMNEHNLMISECTCGAKVHPEPDKKRLFYSAELSRVALERCQTAPEALKLIAELIRDYGFYGTGETLLIGDHNEAWVMEMCGYDADGSNGIWVAQRVPDNHYFIAANEFRIRDIYMSDEEKNMTAAQRKKAETQGLPYYVSNDKENTVLYSKNLFSICKEKGWIDPTATQLDWLPTVSYGEYSHPYYSLRRVWRGFSKAAPLSHLSPKVEDGYTRNYPFSLQPDKKLSVADIAAIYRDEYEGTEFDLTVGPAAGPFANPVRYYVNPDHGNTWNLNTYTPQGAWERPISVYNCGFLWINQAKKVKDEVIGISWIGLDRPLANCLMPFYTKMPELPKSMQIMNLLEFEFKGPSAFWAFNFVANYVNLNYAYMMKDLAHVQNEWESKAFKRINEVLATGNTKGLVNFCTRHVKDVLAAWWDLATRLIVQYNDGALTTGPNSVMEKIDYPRKWLREVGYYDGPTKY